MNQFNNTVGVNSNTEVGLKNFLLGTYRYMALAMGVTALSAYGIGKAMAANQEAFALLQSKWVVLAYIISIPLLFGAVGKKLPSMSETGVKTFLFGFAVYLGLFTAPISIFVDPMVITRIFLMTVGLFAGLSMFGYTTQRDLTTYAKFAGIAFLAYIAIHVVGMFVEGLAPTGAFDTGLSIIALLAVSVFVAFETQFLKRLYYGNSNNPSMMNKMAAFGAASLLLTFVNLFSILMDLFGGE